MPEQLLSRRPEGKRTTRKVEPIAAHPTPWYQRALILIAIAAGGALLGNLGSQLTAYLLIRPSGPATGAANGSTLLSNAPSLAARLNQIDQHLASRDFGTALLLCDEALAIYFSNSQVQIRRQRAEGELHNRFRYQMFEQAAARRNYAASLALWSEIPADSTYKVRATQELPTVRSHFVGERLSDAQTAQRLGQCNEARTYADSVLAIDRASVAARAVLDQCGAGGGSAPAGSRTE
jgi:hypothetical protein